jgi:hypothetical protein
MLLTLYAHLLCYLEYNLPFEIMCVTCHVKDKNSWLDNIIF